MEFEKRLYGVHDHLLRKDCCKVCISFVYFFSILFFVLQFPFFLYGNYAFVGKSPCLQPIINSEFSLNPDSNITRNETLGDKPIIHPEDILDIRIRERYFEEVSKTGEHFNHAHFQFSGRRDLVALNDKIKKEHNFTYYNITIDSDCYASTFLGKSAIAVFLDFETILKNEILTSMKGFDIYLRNFRTNTRTSFSRNRINHLTDNSKSIFFPISLALNLLQTLFALFLFYAVCALFLRFFLILFPITFFENGRSPNIQRQMIRNFPWVGLQYHALVVNGKRVIGLFFGFYCCFVLFWWMLDGVQLYWDFLLFNRPYTTMLSNQFFGVIYWTEVISLIFMRTRTSLKYYPKFTILLIMIYVYYFQHTIIGFDELGLSLLRHAAFILSGYFLLNLEIPALDWDENAHYTPTQRSPRMLYFPAFSLAWAYEIPPIWTMFYPLFGRSYFSNREMAYIDNNQEEVRAMLEEAQNVGMNMEAGELELAPIERSTQIEIDMPQPNSPPPNGQSEGNSPAVNGN